jgi:hypothetical protein
MVRPGMVSNHSHADGSLNPTDKMSPNLLTTAHFVVVYPVFSIAPMHRIYLAHLLSTCIPLTPILLK